jgi:outer membrane protein assembly factor BamA
VSRAFQLYLRTSRPPALNIGSYTVAAGRPITFGVPFSETDTVFFGIGLERTKIETDETVADPLTRNTSPDHRQHHRYRHRDHQRDAADGRLGRATAATAA